VAAVGEVPPPAGARQIDATGLAVTPGFINILSHAWGSLQAEPRAPSDLLQGVTTEVFGEGFSLGPANAEVVSAAAQFGLDEGQRMDFSRLSEGLGHLESRGVAPNVASFVGGHNLRILGGRLSDGPLAPQTLDRLRGILDEEMADGALGLGTALIYPPGSFAGTGELVALSQVVARHDGLYISHMRSEGDQFLECLDELTEIGRRAEVYHLKAAGRANWPKMKAIGSDAEAVSAGPPWTSRPTHPRAYGAFSRFLGHYCRDLRLLTLAEAVRRMTSLPADTLRLRDRGRLTPGAFADVAVFDPAAVSDHATYDKPHAYATGVRHVIVNGHPVVADGALTGALPGRRLRRGA
jgi:N-acyl-D-aspartate/D-glutamate deacylase